MVEIPLQNSAVDLQPKSGTEQISDLDISEPSADNRG